MSWDVAYYGDLTFPSAEAIERWRGAEIDPAPELRRAVTGSVDDVLLPLQGAPQDWIDCTVEGNVVSIRGSLNRDAYNQRAAEVVAAVRAAGDVGAIGELWIVGFGIEPSYVLRLDKARTYSRAKPDSKDPRIAAIGEESARRFRPWQPPVPPARELAELTKAARVADVIETLRTAPMGDYWREVVVVDAQLPALHARFGAEMFAVVLALRARRKWGLGTAERDVLFALASPEATELLVDMLAAPLMAAEIATWMLKHPNLALPALHRVADGRTSEQDRLAAKRYPPVAPKHVIARRLIDALSEKAVTTDPAVLCGKGAGKPPAWFHPALYARPRLSEGPVLSLAACARLVVLLKTIEKGGRPALDEVLPSLERDSVDMLLIELFKVWCKDNSPGKERWIPVALQQLGGQRARAELAQIATELTRAGREARLLLAAAV